MKRKFLYVLFLLMGSTGFAQVHFEAKLSKDTLGLNEYLRVEFTMDKQDDEYFPPSFDGDFIMVSGPNLKIMSRSVNGEHSYSKSISYILKPRRTGRLVIEPAVIQIGNEIYETEMLELEVIEAVENPDRQGVPEQMFPAKEEQSRDSNEIIWKRA